MASGTSFKSFDSMKETLKDLSGLEDGSDCIIIGIDFGTTYSGVAYGFTTNPDEVYTITDWPGARGRSVPKVPTILKYNDDGTFVWGYELDPASEGVIEGIKLLLDPDQPKVIHVSTSHSRMELKRLDKPALDVTSDYMGPIYRHALAKLSGMYPKNYLDMLDKKFVLSVPALWSDKAKDMTLRAARNAGVGPVTLIKEPEAAALFTMDFLQNKGLDMGDAIILCDAGGGTVDLISYEITKMEPLELKELVPCSGGLAGSMILNRRFEEWVKSVVGEDAFLPLRKTSGFRLAMKQFDESIKVALGSGLNEVYYVNFPMANIKDNPRKGVKSNALTLIEEDLEEIFEPLLQDINRLVAEQVQKVFIKRMRDGHPNAGTIKAIFLVGGFGSSAYLRDSIVANHPDIQVIQPENAWSAIVKGAVLSQLPRTATVTSNVAPKHYGVRCASVYDANRDRNERKYWDQWDEVWRCNIMIWYINLGDDLLRSRKISFPYHRDLVAPLTAENLIVKFNLWESSMVIQPVHPKKGDVSGNCTITADFTTVPRHLFKKKTRRSDGVQGFELGFDLMVSIESGPMVFSVGISGKEYGQVSAEY